MKTKLILLVWMLGFMTGVAVQYLYYTNLPPLDPDWLDCIEFEECPVPLDTKAEPRRIQT